MTVEQPRRQIGAILRWGIVAGILLSAPSNAWAESNATTDPGISAQIEALFKPAVDAMASVFFWDPFAASGIYDPVIRDSTGAPVLNADGTPLTAHIPLVVAWLVLGALFFTLRMGFINLRGMKHAIDLVRGKHSSADDKGDVSHFKALATALSATVGLGNIAGVAVAITLGGPGATFWMITAGLLGMSSKFTECTLALKYRITSRDGSVSGGPMYYLSEGLKRRGHTYLGKLLAVVFAILCIGGSLGGGNMFQANQSFLQLQTIAPSLADKGWLFGVVLAVMVGLVIIGGIKSIARVTGFVTPMMCAIYVTASLVVIGMHIEQVPAVFAEIFAGAFDANALKGGFIGVLVTGFQRAAFSNEAGIGSAAIAHSAARTDTPVKEGIVALLEPFIDTVVICTMTALVLIFTGAHQVEGLTGTAMTSHAFGTVISWFPYVLVLAVGLFAFSTMISWSYYGEKAWNYLFGEGPLATLGYKMLFLSCIVVGSAASLGAVIDFSDMMILGMAFPNILGLLMLSGEVKEELEEYWPLRDVGSEDTSKASHFAASSEAQPSGASRRSRSA